MNGRDELQRAERPGQDTSDADVAQWQSRSFPIGYHSNGFNVLTAYQTRKVSN
jgi:hypothetical protein